MRHILPLAFAAAFTAAPAFAQTVSRDTYSHAALQAPLDRSASPLSGIEVTTGQDNATAAIRGNLQISANRGDFSALSFALSTPVNKSGSPTLLGNLDGLTNATTLEVGYHQVHASLRNVSYTDIVALCNQARVARHIPVEDQTCDTEMFVNEAEDLRGQFRELTLGVDSAWFWGVTARAGHQEFTYFNGTTLERLQTDESPWSASAYVAFALPGDNALASLAFTAQDAFKDARTQVLCPGGAPPVTCINGPIGAPVETERRMVTAEYRRELLQQGIGYSFAATYDFETEEYGFDLPIYFLRNGDDQLTGGLRLGWRSDENEVTVGVIISQPFSFLDFNQ